MGSGVLWRGGRGMTPGEFILIPMAASVALGGVIAWAIWRRERVRPSHQCPACGYDLRGNRRDGCPECGWNTRKPVKRM